MRRDEFPIVDKYCKDKIIKELNNIRAEIGIYKLDCMLTCDNKICRDCNNNMFGSIYRIIDKHIKEIEKEN